MSDELNEVSEATNSEEELDLQEQDDTEDVEALKEQLSQAREAQRQILARAKKAEETLKARASQPKPEVDSNPTQSASNIEETVLLANGMSEELLEELKAVATVRKLSLIKAQQDPIFVAVKEKIEKDKKQAEASLPVSRGSGNFKVKKDFKSPGLSREEHKAMFDKLVS